MTTLRTLLALILLASAAHAQTLKSLMFNTTNGQIVVSTNIVWTNGIDFRGAGDGPYDPVSVQITGSLSVYEPGVSAGSFSVGRFSVSTAGAASNSIAIDDNSDGIQFGGNAGSVTRANLGFSANLNTLWTATNAAAARSAVGLDETNSLTFLNITASGIGDSGMAGAQLNGTDRNFVIFYPGFNFTISGDSMSLNGTTLASWSTNGVIVEKPLQFTNAPVAAGTRTNLSLPLPALTNTSNVTMMRALSGSTNTNAPYTGVISFEFDGNPPISLSVSNGIIVEVGTY